MATLASYQTTFFAEGEPTIAGDPSVERLELDELSWVDLGRGWLQGADELLVRLAGSLKWKGGRRPMYGQLVEEPRLHASCPRPAPPALHIIGAMASRLGKRYGSGLDAGFVNFYRDGRDSVAWHADRIGLHEVNPVVAIVSLGGPRRFMLRPMDGGRSTRLVLHSGDLLVMGGACQHAWEHCVPKMASAAPRMSVTFRHVADIPGEEWWYQPPPIG